MPPDARSNTRRHQLYLKAAEKFRDTPIGTSKRPFRSKPGLRHGLVKGLRPGPSKPNRGVFDPNKKWPI